MVSSPLDFLKEYPSGVYKTTFQATLPNGNLPNDIEKMFRTNLERIIEKKEETKYFSNSDEFFSHWLNGRANQKPDLEQYLGVKGFELQLPSVNIERYDNGKSFGRIEGLVLASDFGYTSDFGSSLVFAINDIQSQHVLTYHDELETQIKKNPTGKKLLVPNSIYGFSKKPEEFPFSSLNPLKSIGYEWTLVGIGSQEVYASLRKIGFVWESKT